MRFCHCFLMVVSTMILGCGSIGKANLQAGKTHKNFYVSGRFLYTPDGEKVILRGINNMNVVSDKTGEKSFPEIAKTGANVVRIMWMSWGGGGDKLDVLIGNCIKHKMIPLIELHDATGKWELLDSTVNFWVRPDVRDVLVKYEKYLLLNIANEAGTSAVSLDEFKIKYSAAVYKMRKAGINVPLMIDAANWGRNEAYLLENAVGLLQMDPEHNLLFSWHIWDSGIAESRIEQAVERSIALNFPLVIGEFAPMEVKCKCCIPYKFIIKYCEEKSIGWLAWSWGPGNSDCTQMDMTKTVAFETLHGWGLEVAITDKYSIKNTAVRPAIFK